ncbi:MAG TPA: slipin family protein [Spirochaetota bacterium]|nr:slipin family protein [Spirochaetota bacterium]HOM38608.1 slipin family protein [Spirochaetota bacterium]HPQ49745.1 slipin family protein [Spirochaetota bacterium]
MDIQLILVISVFAILIISNTIKIVPEYVRAVVFRLGRYYKTKGPGLIFVIPGVDRVQRVDLRTVTLDVPIQEVITRDNIPVKVNAVCYFRVVQPEKAVINVKDYYEATSQISQTTLRSVCGQLELDDILAKREEINFKLQKIIDEQTEPWGIKVSIVEIKDVQIPQGMQKAIASQAEAERERRAKIISAEGEFQASQKLSEAADIISKNPVALQLRFLQTIREAASEKNSVIFVPLPMDIFKKIVD